MNIVKMSIDTGDHPPIKQRPYKIPFSQRPQVNKALDDMLEAGIIRPSQSPWSSSLVIIPKKDGTKRMCVDYRKLNNITRKSSSYQILRKSCHPSEMQKFSRKLT